VICHAAGAAVAAWLVKNPRMSTNPYAPPLAVVTGTNPDDLPQAPLFAVSLTKMIVLLIVTFGLYEVVWLYQHWAAIRRRERSDIWPVPRAIFGVIFCWSLFRRVERAGQDAGVAGGPPFGALAVAWILSTICWRLPDPYDWISVLAPLLTIPVQTYANRVNAVVAPGHDRNARFSWINIVFVVLGGGFLLLALIGAALPDPAS
jgi:drug/metabolite transporter superfamily protein YnfA